MSVIVVTNTLEAIAGSMLNFFNEIGTKIPNNPATIIFNIIDIAIKIDKLISLNHNWTITPVIIAKIIPFKIPITNSLITIFPKFPEDIGPPLFWISPNFLILSGVAQNRPFSWAFTLWVEIRVESRGVWAVESWPGYVGDLQEKLIFWHFIKQSKCAGGTFIYVY